MSKQTKHFPKVNDIFIIIKEIFSMTRNEFLLLKFAFFLNHGGELKNIKNSF